MPTYRIKMSGRVSLSFEAADPTAAMRYVRTNFLPSEQRTEYLQVVDADGYWAWNPDPPAIPTRPRWKPPQSRKD